MLVAQLRDLPLESNGYLPANNQISRSDFILYFEKAFMTTYVFNGDKLPMFAIWARSQNYPFNNFFIVLIVFVDHENIGKKPKFMILLCTVQKLWLFVIYP